MRFLVGQADAIPPGSVRVVRPDPARDAIGVFNVAGEFFALRDRCPHMDAPLCSAGTITGTSRAVPGEGGAPGLEWERDGEIVACPWHRWEFDIRTGRTLVPSRRRVRSYPVVVEDGAVILELP